MGTDLSVGGVLLLVGKPLSEVLRVGTVRSLGLLGNTSAGTAPLQRSDKSLACSESGLTAASTGSMAASSEAYKLGSQKFNKTC